MADAKISGSGIIGSGEYDDIRISGSGKIDGDCKAKSLHISGSSRALGKIEIDEIKISGSGSFEKKVIANTITASGSIKLNEDCEANEITISGFVTCNGTLNADNLHVECGSSKFKEICGDRIKIVSKNKPTTVENIEATNIDLFGVICEFVSGQNVTIGGQCEINVVEYSESLNISSNAIIRKVIKI